MGNKLRIGITQGDVAGIGWEVILKALADGRMGELAEFTVYGSKKAAAFYAGQEFVLPPIVDTGDVDFEPGVPTGSTGESAVKALQRATEAYKRGELDAIVTAPICKEFVADFGFIGHTEFFGTQFDGRPLMVMTSDGLRVALVTVHMALVDVPGAISRDKIAEKLSILNDSLVRDFGVVKPRIAVLALNPHGGENGLLGSDEEEVIKPATEQAYKNGILAFGPLAADGVFLNTDRYDAVLAMYHDQGLAPFKALAPDGVNFTAGLSVVRTSPDHGTAFDIAGKGVASADSMRAAVYAAMDIVRNRKTWEEISRNPLKHYEREKGDERTIDFSKSEL